MDRPFYVARTCTSGCGGGEEKEKAFDRRTIEKPPEKEDRNRRTALAVKLTEKPNVSQTAAMVKEMEAHAATSPEARETNDELPDEIAIRPPR